MNIRVFISGLAMALIACAAHAFPRVIIYNYIAPQPSLELTSIKPADQQEFSFQQKPEAVVASFTEAIDPDNSDLKVYDGYNRVVSGEKSMPKDTNMTVNIVGDMYKGNYHVEWKATCACSGHAQINGITYFSIY